MVAAARQGGTAGGSTARWSLPARLHACLPVCKQAVEADSAATGQVGPAGSHTCLPVNVVNAGPRQLRQVGRWESEGRQAGLVVTLIGRPMQGVGLACLRTMPGLTRPWQLLPGGTMRQVSQQAALLWTLQLGCAAQPQRHPPPCSPPCRAHPQQLSVVVPHVVEGRDGDQQRRAPRLELRHEGGHGGRKAARIQPLLQSRGRSTRVRWAHGRYQESEGRSRRGVQPQRLTDPLSAVLHTHTRTDRGALGGATPPA